jgi:hypothetical protein
MTTQVDDKGIVFAAGSEYSTFSTVGTPIVGDKVTLYMLGSGQKLAVPNLTFGLSDVIWVVPSFQFAGFDWTFDWNLNAIKIGSGSAMFWSSWGGSYSGVPDVDQFYSVTGDGSGGGIISTWYRPGYPLSQIENGVLFWIPGSKRYVDFDYGFTGTFLYNDNAHHYIRFNGQSGGYHDVYAYTPTQNQHIHLDLGVACTTLRLGVYAIFSWDGSTPVIQTLSNVVFS